jgi:hypothetical protein
MQTQSMKLFLASLATTAIAGTAFAGTMIESKASKDYKPIEPTLCFADHEWQVDLFGQYSVGEGPTQAGIFRDHGWGGGIGVNYFFTRNWGLGADAAWLYAKEPDYVTNDAGNSHTTLHNFSGSVIFRIPMDELCLAPYIYAGAGATVDGEQWASGHGGVGVEYRFSPGKGVFVDGRWTYLGDRFGHEDLNYFSTRVGFRFTF